MAPRPTIERSLIFPNMKWAAIADTVAGDHTVTGIRVADKLMAVVGFTVVLTDGTPNTIAFTVRDLTSEFTITAADTINNASGTSLVDGFAMVVYLDVPEDLDST